MNRGESGTAFYLQILTSFESFFFPFFLSFLLRVASDEEQSRNRYIKKNINPVFIPFSCWPDL